MSVEEMPDRRKEVLPKIKPVFSKRTIRLLMLSAAVLVAVVWVLLQGGHVFGLRSTGVLSPELTCSADGCPAAFNEVSGELEWWQSAVTYQVYPRSFQDSDGDGVGDLKGIVSRLDYLKDLGVGTVWLSPVYRSPMLDFGYDVSNFTDIDPIFGTLQEFDALVKGLHDRGMKLVMDYIPNHTSDQHIWFQESRKGGENNPYLDFYVWSDGKLSDDGMREPPNNWICMSDEPAWTWVEERQQFYYHEYMAEQPDLNWRNPRVFDEMLKVFKFWLDRGVDGFRLDAISKMYEVEDVSLNEPLRKSKHTKPAGTSGSLEHIYTRNQNEICGTVGKWREFFNEYEASAGRPHIYMVAELYDKTMLEAMKYYHCGADGPFNFNLLYIKRDTRADGIFKMVDSWLRLMAKDKWPTWVTGNHDGHRIADVRGPEFVNAFNTLLLLLPGSPTTYQGEELGMRDIHPSFEESQDPRGKAHGEMLYDKYTRDHSRGPMQWSSELNAGFSTAAKPWLPIHTDYKTHNMHLQRDDASGISNLQFYRKLNKLRQHSSFQKGSMTYSILNKNVFSFVRHVSGQSPYLVAINFGDQTSRDDYSKTLAQYVLLSGGKLVLSTSLNTRLRTGMTVDKDFLSDVALEPAEVIVIELQVF